MWDAQCRFPEVVFCSARVDDKKRKHPHFLQAENLASLGCATTAHRAICIIRVGSREGLVMTVESDRYHELYNAVVAYIAVASDLWYFIVPV